MHPIICAIGPFTVYSYGLMLALAFAAGVSLAGRQAKRENVNPEIIFNFSFLVFISGIIGARVFYIIGNLGYYLKNPAEIIMLQRGGLAWFGGLILGTACGIIYLKKKSLPLCKTLDLVIPFVALGQAIGRIGCLLNGCCFGRASRSGLYFDVHSDYLIPTQLYSSLLLTVIFIILRLLQDRPHKEGEIFYSYLFLYSLKRFSIEFWRADNPRILLGLTLFQLLSLALFVFSSLKFISSKRTRI